MSESAFHTPDPSNLELWNSLCQTDPKFTKDFNTGKFSGTSICPTWVVRRLTGTFGPVGVGWDFDVQYFDKIETGENESVFIVQGRLKYRISKDSDSQPHAWNYTAPQFGGCALAGVTSRGKRFVDPDAPKKAMTSALKKCAYFLGLGGDINLGLWDDDAYVQHDAAPESPDPAEGPPAGTPEKTKKPMQLWTSDEWAERLANCETLPPLAETFDKLRADHKHGKREWKKICQVFCDRFRDLDNGDEAVPVRVQFLAAAQEENEKMK